MNAPFHHRRTFFLAAFIAGWGFWSWAVAQQPAAAPPPPAEAKSQRPRVKPQVIYHLPPASNYAAALHSQAKTQRDTIPVDNSMPTSRGAANEAAANAPPEVGAGPRPKTNSAPVAPARVMKPRSHSPGPSLRHKPASKGHGHGNGHGNKSHHK
ncbi:MAG TPA: hypothetical protein VJU77_14350 [Chthoniobacterales bacterium]|nr:hypothetical protein [Chthoniobacterales bacterium]